MLVSERARIHTSGNVIEDSNVLHVAGTTEVARDRSSSKRKVSKRARTYVSRYVVEDSNVLHVGPVVVLRVQEGQEDRDDEGGEQAEAAAGQRWSDLLQCRGVEHPVLDVGLHQPGCDTHDLTDDASCT